MWKAQVWDLLMNLPLGCRYSPNLDLYRKQGAIIGAMAMFLAIGIALFAYVRSTHLIAVLFIGLTSGIVGGISGALLGFLCWPLVAWKPFWLVRQVQIVDEDGTVHYQLNPIVHSYLMAHAVPLDDVREGDPRGPKPAVHLGSTWWTIIQAVGYRLLFSPPNDRMRKLQTYSLWTIAGLMAIALVLVIALTAD